MADFNNTLDQTQTQNYTEYSKGYKDTALGGLFSNLAENFDAGIKAGDAFITRRLGEDARNMVEPLRDAAIADVAGYQGNAVSYTDENGNTAATPADGNTKGTGTLPSEASAQFNRLGLVKRGVAAGRLSDSYYRSQLDVVSKKLRRMYPGYEDQIDDRMQALTGSIPANKLLADLQAEASAASAAGSQNKFLNEWLKATTGDNPALDPTTHPFNSYNGDFQKFAQDVYPAQKDRADLELSKSKLARDTAQNKVDVTNTTKDLNSNMGNETTKIFSDITGQFGKSYPEIKKKIDSMDPNVPWSPEEVNQIEAQHQKTVMGLRAKLGAMASNPINEKGDSFASVVGQDAVNTAIDAQVARIDSMFYGISKKDPFWNTHNAALAQTYKDGRSAEAQADPVTGWVSTMQDIGGPALVSSYMLDGTNSARVLSHINQLARDKVVAGILVGDSGDPRLAKYNSLDEAISSVVDPNTKPAEREALSGAIIDHLKRKVGDERIPIDQRLKIAGALYGPGNSQFATKTIPIYNRMIDPQALKDVHKLSVDSGRPEVWNNALNWTMGTGTTLARNFAVQMSQANLDPNGAIRYDLSSHMFTTDFQGVSFKGETYDDHQATKAAVDNMNKIVHSMIPVLKEDNPKTSDQDINTWVLGLTNAFGNGLGSPVFKSFNRAANASYPTVLAKKPGGAPSTIPDKATANTPMFSFDQNGRIQLNFSRNPETGALEKRASPMTPFPGLQDSVLGVAGAIRDEANQPNHLGASDLASQASQEDLMNPGSQNPGTPSTGNVGAPESVLTGGGGPPEATDPSFGSDPAQVRQGILLEMRDVHDMFEKTTDPAMKEELRKDLQSLQESYRTLRQPNIPTLKSGPTPAVRPGKK